MSEETFQLGEGVNKFLGADKEFESNSEFQEWFGATFIRKTAINDDSETRNKVVGKRLGEVEVLLGREAKNLGLEISKEGKLEDRITSFKDAIVSKYETSISELKSKVGEGSDEATLKLQSEVDKLKSSLNEKDGLLKENLEKYESAMSEFTKKETNRRITDHRSKAFNSFPVSTDAPTLAIDGFKARVNDEVILKFDEQDNIIPVDKDGNRFKSNEIADKFLTTEEVYQQKAIELGLHAKSPSANKEVNNTPVFKESKLEEGDSKRKGSTPMFARKAQ